MKIFSKVFTNIVLFLTSIMLIAFLAFHILSFMNINANVVLSASMEPTIPVKSLIFIDNNDSTVHNMGYPDPDTWKGGGDVVEYEMQNAKGESVYIVHRVVGQNPDGTYITKGDNNDVEDTAPVTAAQIHGHVKWVIPHLGEIMKSYMLLVAIAVLGANILAFLFRVIADDQQDDGPEEVYDLEEGLTLN